MQEDDFYLSPEWLALRYHAHKERLAKELDASVKSIFD